MQDHLGGVVELLVTHAALDRIEIPKESGDDYLARFDKHRDSFERVADDKFVRGKIEDDGSIALLASDLESQRT